MKVERFEWIKQASDHQDQFVIQTKGCNLNCSFCWQREQAGALDSFLAMEDIVWEILQNRDRIKTVVFSGGEPTLQEDLSLWAGILKEEGFEVRLETNGTRPDQLETLIAEGVIDFISLDIKSCPSGYAVITGEANEFTNLTDQVECSLNVLSYSGIPYEIRTTLIADHHDMERMRSMAKWVGGQAPWVLQQYRTLDKVCMNESLTSYTLEEMMRLKQELKNEFGLDEVQLKCDY